MASNLLATLAAVGIVQRAGIRLRITPRFLAHAEGTAGRLHTMGRPHNEHVALQEALATWDAPVPLEAVEIVQDLMDRHDQWGMVRPVFPVAIAA